MTTSDITWYRLHYQQIVAAQAKDPGGVVARLGALQAQDYPGAQWSIGLRLPDGAVEADIERAVADRSIVRTWPMRGTLHFVAAADVRWMLELLTPRVLAGSAARQRQLGLDDAIFARSKELFAQALAGGKQLTREEMYQTLERGGISPAGQRGYHLLWRNAQEGLICFGSHTGKQPTFTLLDEWIPGARHWEREEALAELARRYFTGHGPATMHDFCWWSGLLTADAKAGLEMAKPHLMPETVDGKVYWMSRGTPDAVAASRHAAPSVFLLPGFDEYLLGYTDRRAALDPLHAPKIVPGNNGMFMATLVIDGRVAGTWKRTLRKQAVTVMGLPFAALSDAEERAIAVAAQRYGRFLGLPVTHG
jgi:hypothetical protein